MGTAAPVQLDTDGRWAVVSDKAAAFEGAMDPVLAGEEAMAEALGGAAFSHRVKAGTVLPTEVPMP